MSAFVACCFLVILFALCLLPPAVALAEIKQVTITPAQFCGPRCVIESYKCDTKSEAEYLVKEKHGYKRSAPYKIEGSEKWWVDVHVTEAEANLI